MRPPFASSVSSLKTAPESRTWYRALQTHFLPTALSTNHTKTVASRFSGASPGSPGFEVLYLAENHLVALLEVQALLGSPTTPGGVVALPHSSWTVLNVSVTLQAIADLTDVSAQKTLEMTAQELTGDWLGYRQRGPGTSVKAPIGLAPTQELGAALNGVPGLEGFRTLSAKAPYQEILVIFPKKLQTGSRVSWVNPLSGKAESIP